MKSLEFGRTRPKYVSRYYELGCEIHPRTLTDYEHVKVIPRTTDDYQILNKLGRGKYSEVFEGVDVTRKLHCVIKVLKPVKKEKIRREVMVLQFISKGPFIVSLYDIVKNEQTKVLSLVFEYVNNMNFKSLYSIFCDFDIRYYMYKILKALDYCHSQGVMHRDIKPHNIMIDHQTRKLRVIDWGLAEFYHPGKEYNVRVASRYYKSPELILDDGMYDYSLDIWSLGCTFGEMLFQKHPLFSGKNNADQLVKIAKILGTKELMHCLEKYHMVLNKDFSEVLGKHSRKPWSTFITKANRANITEGALDLLSKMLKYDKAERISAEEALKHPYFGIVKPYIESVILVFIVIGAEREVLSLAA
eukprot:TRINITY_DN7498_c0_g1_i4.p1 TRINITY_DN7498_c0_g1~~TRINITY_DN7498_c0_g1_i4.p1  ORF type:complete len:359 (-),score=100.45 TRINITY_DN7498_c0_g1_i4:198-1274(-)